MVDAEWPEKGYSLADARKCSADPADWDDWLAKIKRLKNLGPQPSFIAGDRIQDVHSYSEYKNRLNAAARVAEDKIKGKFRSLLEAQELFAWGRKGSLTASPELIPGDIWPALTHIDLHSSTAAENRTDGMVFLAVRVYATSPTIPNEEPIEEKECRLWLENKMRESPDLRPSSKASIWKDAKERWPKLAHRAFNRIRDKALKDTGAGAWRRSGAPKKLSR